MVSHSHALEQFPHFSMMLCRWLKALAGSRTHAVCFHVFSSVPLIRTFYAWTMHVTCTQISSVTMLLWLLAHHCATYSCMLRSSMIVDCTDEHKFTIAWSSFSISWILMGLHGLMMFMDLRCFMEILWMLCLLQVSALNKWSSGCQTEHWTKRPLSRADYDRLWRFKLRHNFTMVFMHTFKMWLKRSASDCQYTPSSYTIPTALRKELRCWQGLGCRTFVAIAMCVPHSFTWVLAMQAQSLSLEGPVPSFFLGHSLVLVLSFSLCSLCICVMKGLKPAKTEKY